MSAALGKAKTRAARWRWAPVVALVLASIGAARAAPPPDLSPGILAALDAAQTGGHKFPPADQVFHFNARAAGARQITLTWSIRAGYYLYRDRIHVSAPAGAPVGPLQLPAGELKVDPYFGREQIYRNQVSGEIPVRDARAAGASQIPLTVTYQGCADAGLCYPPITKTVQVSWPGGSGGAASAPPGASPSAYTGPAAAHPPASAGASATSAQGHFARLARSGSLLAMIGWFYLAGLALAFTPCCLPTLPIISAIIVGQGRPASTGRAFLLSLIYVLGMAFTYTLAGAAAAAAGGEIQAAFQRPWILIAFAAVLATMGIAMLGLFALQMPSGLQTRLAALSHRQTAGTLGGVAIMGALSALIVTTCVAPALVGALAVIGRTGEVTRGAAALFALSIGMGTPLLALGASAGRLLPKAGPWMNTVKRLFGALMLAVAVWMLSRLLSPQMTLALWAVPAVAAAWVLLAGANDTPSGRWPLRLGGALAGLYGLALMSGAALGGTNPLEPFPGLTGPSLALQFTPVRSVAELDRDVARAQRLHRTVMVDFYAAWCTSCKELEATTFTDPAVRRALSHTVLLRADVTANNAADKALLEHFGIFGPPTVAFYDGQGRELRRYQVVGYMDAQEFLQQLHAAFGPLPAS